MMLSRQFVLGLALSLAFPLSLSAQDWIHRAQQGDTLWDLCLHYTAKRGCWLELGRYNQMSDQDFIPLGTEVRIPLTWLRKLPVVGQVQTVTGVVSVSGAGHSASRPLEAGQQLQLGDKIECQQGNARITLHDQTEVLLRPNSSLELNTFSASTAAGSRSEVAVPRGDIEVHVPPQQRSRFEVHTPSAVTAVRGTRFRVTSSDGASPTTRNEVLQGLVSVDATTQTDLPAGYGLLARQGQPLEQARKLLPAPLFKQPDSTGPLPLLIDWQAHPDATAWQLDLLTDDSAQQVLASHQTAAPQWQFNELPVGCYRLAVRAIDEAGFRGLDASRRICVQEPVPEPVVEQPESHLDLLLWVGAVVLMLL